MRFTITHELVLHKKLSFERREQTTSFFFIIIFFYESLCQIKQGIQDSIANVQYPNYKDINTQNEKEANIKVKLMKVWI